MNDNRDDHGHPLGRAGRILLVGWSLVLLGGFLLAAGLEPDARGYGTHQQLGLPPCTFHTLFGIPCPSCGMTTSFSHFVRGQFGAAARANSAGLLLAILCTLQIPWCLWSAACGRLWKVLRPDVALAWLLAVISTACVLQWAFRLVSAS